MMRRGIGRVGRPSLVRTAARTAVVAGTATAVVGGVSRHQNAKAQEAADAQTYEEEQQQAAMDAAAQQAAAQQAAAQQAAAAPPPPPAPAGGMTDEVISQLKQLAELKDAGILTEEEFTAKKTSLLGL